MRESEGVGRRVPGLGGEAAAHAGCLRCPCIGSVTREMMYSPHSLEPVTAHPRHTSSLQALKAPGTRCKYRCTSSTRIVRMGFRHAVQVPVHNFNTHCSYGLQARGASTGAHLQHALFVCSVACVQLPAPSPPLHRAEPTMVKVLGTQSLKVCSVCSVKLSDFIFLCVRVEAGYGMYE